MRHKLPPSEVSYSQHFEWREAARFGGVPYHEFETLDGIEQSRIVAHYRAKQRLDAVLSHDQARKAKRRRVGDPGRLNR